jgi:pyrrolysyl-tRNA synthetase-like protein
MKNSKFHDKPKKRYADSAMAPEKKLKKPAKRYYRKRVELFRLIDKIKLWPSRKGILHGIKTIQKLGDQAQITTHCNKTFMVNNSRSSRAARWLRNKWITDVCQACGVPDWKLAKYSSTQFKRHHGSLLIKEGEKHQDRK